MPLVYVRKDRAGREAAKTTVQVGTAHFKRWQPLDGSINVSVKFVRLEGSKHQGLAGVEGFENDGLAARAKLKP